MALESYARGEKVALGGAVLGALGSFLPWVEVSILGVSQSASGIESNAGLIVVGVAVAVCVALVARNPVGAGRALVGVAGLVIAGLAGLYVNDPTVGSDFESQAEAELAASAAEPAFGLYVVLVGGVLVVVGAALGFESETPAHAGPTPQQPAAGRHQGQPRQASQHQQAGGTRQQGQASGHHRQHGQQQHGQQQGHGQSQRRGQSQNPGGGTGRQHQQGQDP